MEESNLPFSQHFLQLDKKPKWGIKLFLSITTMILSTILGSLAIDYTGLYRESGLTGEQLEQAKAIGRVGRIIGSSFMVIVEIGITFFLFLLICKIMKKGKNKKVVFSATLSYVLITSFIGLIVILIQWLAGLSPLEYSITSLNIFDKGNKMLGALNAQTFIGGYIFGIMLYKTFDFSKKATIIWTISYLVLLISFSAVS